MRKVIANTTPLIALANIDQLELLRKLYGTIIVPQTGYCSVSFGASERICDLAFRKSAVAESGGYC